MMSTLYVSVRVQPFHCIWTDMIVTVLALDPTIKLEYAKNNWDSEAYNAGYAAFKKVVWIFRADPSRFIIYLL